MGLVIRIGNQFEVWSCQHVDFNRLVGVWPNVLEDKFGDACMDFLPLTALEFFGDRDCLRVAMRVRLPIHFDGKLPVPVDLTAPNPAADSAFREFRIQTVWTSNEGGDVSAYTRDDDPFEGEFSEP